MESGLHDNGLPFKERGMRWVERDEGRVTGENWGSITKATHICRLLQRSLHCDAITAVHEKKSTMVLYPQLVGGVH